MDYFRAVFQELQAAHGALVDASQAMLRAGEHMVKATETAIHAQEEHEDLRETVTRVEALVMQQGDELRALRDDLRRARNGGPAA